MFDDESVARNRPMRLAEIFQGHEKAPQNVSPNRDPPWSDKDVPENDGKKHAPPKLSIIFEVQISNITPSKTVDFQPNHLHSCCFRAPPSPAIVGVWVFQRRYRMTLFWYKKRICIEKNPSHFPLP